MATARWQWYEAGLVLQVRWRVLALFDSGDGADGVEISL
jgi:hypothetical protein